MSNLMTLQEAFDSWESEIKPLVIEQYSEDDEPAINESWNNYTDSLCKDGQLTDLQYKYCPGYDDGMPDNDLEFIIEQLGLPGEYAEQFEQLFLIS
jgi:hypothetical protein